MLSLCRSLAWRVYPAFLAVAWTLTAAPAAHAQLEITEVLYDSLSAGDNAWEWIEVRNLGASAVDLDGAYAARVGDDEAFAPAVDGTLATDTVIPAGGTAVLYDANLGAGNPSNFNDQQFRDAWGLDGSVALVGVASFPALTNSGTAFGFWADGTAYANDVSDIGNGPEVTSLANTLFSLDYTTGSDFPPNTSGTSMRWSGSGAYQVGSNWALSAPGETGVVTSTVVSVPGSTNSTDDIGSPGKVPTGAVASGLLITEIMYNPASPENVAEWEWIEIYNNTGSTIDFSTTPYVLDDDDDAAHDLANITFGSVADDAVAVLFNAYQISQQDMIDAWDPGSANGTNFIDVSGTNWTGGFANGGDTVALWDDFAIGYLGETVTAGPGRTTDNAVSVVNYDDDGTIWPQDSPSGGGGSIFLTDLSSDQNVGANWRLSAASDGLSFNATALPGTIVVHPGDDIGSPGTFSTATTSPVDLDGDGDVDGQDFLLIQQTDPALIPQWQLEFGSGVGALAAAAAVPEPGALGLLGLALGLAPLARRRRR